MKQPLKRITVTASRDSLATLEAEAGRRGVSLSALLAEAVDEKAAGIRAARRRPFGMRCSTDGRSARVLASEPVARPPS